MRPHLLFAFALLTGCPPKPTDTSVESIDLDGDGYSEELDCDDGDALVHPGAEEVCNGVDDDCDGFLDEDDLDLRGNFTLHRDVDEDAWGSMEPEDERAFCTDPGEGWVEDATDCDDADEAVHPGAQEICNGEDEDCDGEIDEDGALDSTWYRDADGDGYGDDEDFIVQCAQPYSYVLDPGDCDDTDDAIHPEAEERCDGVDQDCDGEIDEDAVDATTWYADSDADGWGDDADVTVACEAPSGAVGQGGDCDDTQAEVHPEAEEHCDGVDEDCDGDTDEGAVDAPTWYADADADGYGDAAVALEACTQPSGYLADATDCDDGDDTIHPGADEHCDGVDEDCDGEADEDPVDLLTWYADADGDSYGDAAVTTEACTQPSDFVADATDCDDVNDAVFPGADEHCDGVDEDCDGSVDEGAVDAPTWYDDIDGDGYGDPGAATQDCTAPTSTVADSSDCDDTDASVYPGADEHCDSVDEDCDGMVDEGAVDAPTWYDDIDADGYGDPAAATQDCTAPTSTVADSSDCDDTDANVYPGADEHCDGVDEDCDGDIDDGAVDADTWYADADGDAYGDTSSSVEACIQPSGYLADATDCDDDAADVHPGADEHCDGVDEDCDGDIDEGAVDMPTWHLDGDGDGFGGAATSTQACSQPTGYAATDDDCDDSAASVHPGADEHCDSVDEDCDGDIDEGAVDAGTWYADDDGDSYGDPGAAVEECTQPSGYLADDTDCDDSDASVHPGADEHCDDADEDCDGAIDEGAVDEATWYIDVDGDGYGDPTGVQVLACDLPSGYSDNLDDCDDSDSSVHPGAMEFCNGLDDDCDGTTDGAGLVTFVSAYGGVSDLSSAFALGTSSAAYAATLATSGTLTLCAGTYYAEVTVRGADVTVVGQDGSSATHLVGDGTGSVISVQSTCGDLTLEGLTIEGGGQAASLGGGLNGGAHGVAMVLDDVVVQDCSALSGGGIYQESGSFTATDLAVQDNTASNFGAGIYLNGVVLDLTSSDIEGNGPVAEYGGGIYAADCTATLDDVTIADNSSSSYAGGAIFYNGTTTIDSSTIESNSAYRAAGLMIYHGSATITSSDIQDNVASYNGGGLYVTWGTATMTDSRIHGNSATGISGGVFLNYSASLTCYGTSSSTAGIYGNASGSYGGGVYFYDTGVTLTSSVCDWGNGGSDNSPDDIALYYGYSTYRGYHSDETFSCTVYGCY